MPVSDDLHPRNFVTKITKYEHVVDIPNSNTILADLLPAAILLAKNMEFGVYNFVLSLFKKHVRPSFEWKNFSIEEQSKVLKAGRSNCLLDTTKLVNKLQEYNCKVPEIHQAYEQCFIRMAQNGVK
jgi:3,5-epimerase/4-reductase